MKCNLRQPLWIIIFALCLSSSDQIVAQTQSPRPTSVEAEHGDITYRVQVQFLVASNLADPKTRTDYPTSLEAVVKELKSLLPYRKHYLVATYFYNVAESSALEVHDVTYAAFEGEGALHPMLFDLGISGIKLNTNNNFLRVPKFRFEARQRIAMGATPPLVETVGTGITTELNLRDGVPTIVGTITNALSNAVVVLVVTVDHVGVR
ncbi:MAG: hypothetical protein ACJ741_04370 [Pyrinomonadaceae bacterium]